MTIYRLALMFAGITAVALLAVVQLVQPPMGLRPPSHTPQAVLIENANLVSMDPNRSIEEPFHSVLVVGDVITAIGPTGTIDFPGEVDLNDTQTVDAGGATLLPGLIDAHVHLWDEAELAAYLASGVTSIRNMSGLPFHLSVRDRLIRGSLLGPDLQTTGPILNSAGPNVQDNHVLIETADEAIREVQFQYRAGFETIKVYSNLTRSAYEAARNEAQRLDMSIVGHTPEGTRHQGVPSERPFSIAFEEVLADEFHTIEHVESIFWHGLHDRIDAARSVELSLRIAEADVIVTPTLIAHDNLVRVAETNGEYLERPNVNWLNPLVNRFEEGSFHFWSNHDPASREGLRREIYRTLTGTLHASGVTLVAGSDAGIFTNIPGTSLIEELELLVTSGLTPYEALASATRDGANAIELEDRGQITVGYRANLLLVDGDPLRHISDLSRPVGVMIGGVWLNSDDLQNLRETATQTSEFRTLWHLLPMFWSSHF